MVRDWRELARKIKERGTLERRNWDPHPDSAHYRVYRYWQRKSKHMHVTNENFCHYWRVVFLWAPLHWLAFPAFVVLVVGAVGMFGWLIAANILTVLEVVSVLLLVMALIGYIVGSVLVLMQLLYELNDELCSHMEGHWLDRRSASFMPLATFLSAPVLILATAVFSIVSLLVTFLLLESDYQLYSRAANWFKYAQFNDKRPVRWFRPWMVVPGAIVALSPWLHAARVLLVVCGVIILAVLVLGILAFLADAAKDIAAHIEKPRFLQRNTPTKSTSDRDADTEVASPRSRVRRIVSGTLDMLSLVWAIVLVRKWRVCPMVELPR